MWYRHRFNHDRGSSIEVQSSQKAEKKKMWTHLEGREQRRSSAKEEFPPLSFLLGVPGRSRGGFGSRLS